jgi:hypothetical protein
MPSDLSFTYETTISEEKICVELHLERFIMIKKTELWKKILLHKPDEKYIMYLCLPCVEELESKGWKNLVVYKDELYEKKRKEKYKYRNLKHIITSDSIYGDFKKCRLCGEPFGGDCDTRYDMIDKRHRHISQICQKCAKELEEFGWVLYRSGNYMGSGIPFSY